MKKTILVLIVLFTMLHIPTKTSTVPPSNNNLDTTAYTLPKLKRYVRGTIVSIRIPMGEVDLMATISIDTNGDGRSDIIADCEPKLALKILKARNMGLSITFELVFQNEKHEITDYADSR